MKLWYFAVFYYIGKGRTASIAIRGLEGYYLSTYKFFSGIDYEVEVSDGSGAQNVLLLNTSNI